MNLFDLKTSAVAEHALSLIQDFFIISWIRLITCMTRIMVIPFNQVSWLQTLRCRWKRPQSHWGFSLTKTLDESDYAYDQNDCYSLHLTLFPDNPSLSLIAPSVSSRMFMKKTWMRLITSMVRIMSIPFIQLSCPQTLLRCRYKRHPFHSGFVSLRIFLKIDPRLIWLRVWSEWLLFPSFNFVPRQPFAVADSALSFIQDVYEKNLDETDYVYGQNNVYSLHSTFLPSNPVALSLETPSVSFRICREKYICMILNTCMIRKRGIPII